MWLFFSFWWLLPSLGLILTGVTWLFVMTIDDGIVRLSWKWLSGLVVVIKTARTLTHPVSQFECVFVQIFGSKIRVMGGTPGFLHGVWETSRGPEITGLLCGCSIWSSLIRCPQMVSHGQSAPAPDSLLPFFLFPACVSTPLA